MAELKAVYERGGNICHSRVHLCVFNLSDGAFDRVLPIAEGMDKYEPNGLAVSPDGAYVAMAVHATAYDEGGNHIHVVRLDGSEAPRFFGQGGTGPGQFNRPMDVAFTPDGEQLLVADNFNDRIQVVGLDGTFVREIPFPNACGVSVDRLGNIVALSDTKVSVFSLTGELLQDGLGDVTLAWGWDWSGMAMHLASGRVALSKFGPDNSGNTVMII